MEFMRFPDIKSRPPPVLLRDDIGPAAEITSESEVKHGLPQVAGDHPRGTPPRNRGWRSWIENEKTNELRRSSWNHKEVGAVFSGDCAKLGGTCCALLACHRLLPAEGGLQAAKPIDMTQLSYCGIPCVKVCPMYKATQENDVKMKKILYERQEMKKKFGFDFDPDKVFCYTCKPGDKPKKVGMDVCPVRQCALANDVESCVQCANLDACDKEYWKKWPGQYASTKMIQARYRTQPGAVIKEIKAKPNFVF